MGKKDFLMYFGLSGEIIQNVTIQAGKNSFFDQVKEMQKNGI